MSNTKTPLAVFTGSTEPLAGIPPMKDPYVNACSSPLAAGGEKKMNCPPGFTARRKSLTIQTQPPQQRVSSPSSFDFSELDRAMAGGGARSSFSGGSSADNSPRQPTQSQTSLLKSSISPTSSPNSFLQRYNIFNAPQGLGGWTIPHAMENSQNDLTPYILDTETRALLLFHPPTITPAAIRTACQKFGVLYYLKSNFHTKGVTFFGYFDIQSSIAAHAKLEKQFASEEGEISVHYSIMLGESFNDSDAKLTLNNVGADVAEGTIQTEFEKFGSLSSIQRKFAVVVDSPPQNGIKRKNAPKLCEFAIEFFDIQDAKKAFDIIQPKVKELFGPTAALNPSPLGKRWQSMLQKLTELLLSWKASLISQGVECNSPVTWTGVPLKKFPGTPKLEFSFDIDVDTCSDENSDPSASPRRFVPNTQPLPPPTPPVPIVAATAAGRDSRYSAAPPPARKGGGRTQPGYRDTDMGLVEITPPDSPRIRTGDQLDSRSAYYPPDDVDAYHQHPAPPAETFHTYRHQLLMEHQKLLKMQAAILESLPPDSPYDQSMTMKPTLPRREEQGIGRREVERHQGMPPGNYHPGGGGYGGYGDVGGGGGWHGPGQEYYGDEGGYDTGGGEWGQQNHQGYAPNHGYPQTRPDNRPYHAHQGQGRGWQNNPSGGGRGGLPRGNEYAYDPQSGGGAEYDRYRGGPRHHGGRYLSPAPFNGNPNGGYPAPHRGGGGYSYGDPSMEHDGRGGGRYEHKWMDRDQQEQNKANASFTVRVEDILSGMDARATIMVKNIPNKYSQAMLLDEINSKHSVSYDFFYLPMDFKNRCNVGYAFVNFTDQNDVVVFFSLFHGRKWDHFNSEKICAVTYARIQGKQSLVSRYQNSSLLDREDSYKPLLFYSRGHPLEGQPEPFPIGGGGGGGKPQNRGYSGAGQH